MAAHLMATVLFKDGVERQYGVAEFPTREDADRAFPAMMDAFKATMNQEDLRYVAVGTTMILLDEVVAINFSMND